MQVPKQLKHCVTSVMDKAPFKGRPAVNGDPDQARFLDAWNICLAKIQQNGYAVIESGQTPLYERIRLTSKGIEREFEHLKDTTGRSVLFDGYFEKYKGLL